VAGDRQDHELGAGERGGEIVRWGPEVVREREVGEVAGVAALGLHGLEVLDGCGSTGGW
jgi:hypothetical protein